MPRVDITGLCALLRATRVSSGRFSITWWATHWSLCRRTVSRIFPSGWRNRILERWAFCRRNATTIASVTVSDNGIGFENNYSSSIFSLFETLNPKGTYEGSGIGLAIAKKIVEKHHGFILAKSSLGEESEFSVILPFKQPNSAKWEKRYYLLKSDSDDRLLFQTFFSVRTDISLLPPVTNGLEMIGFLNSVSSDKELPDLIVLDQNMPKMNGKQTLTFLKSSERYSKIPVVIYSTYTDNTLVVDCKKLGADMVAVKPIDHEGYQKMMDDFLRVINLTDLNEPSCLSSRVPVRTQPCRFHEFGRLNLMNERRCLR